MLADETDEHPLVRSARHLADTLLRPSAAEVDLGVVPRSHLDALAAAGLLGIGVPASADRAGVPPAVLRRIGELLAGADLTTWFVQVQHHAPVRMAAAAGHRPDLVADLGSGRLLAGIGFSHLRRWPQRPVEAVPDGNGWRFTGTVPWYTGWGINDVALLAAVTGAGTVVFGLVPAREQPGLVASPPLRTAALQACATVALQLKGLRVAPENVLLEQPIAQWAAQDRATTANVNPAVFGLAGSALDLLRAEGERRGEAEAAALAERLGSRLAEVRAECYRWLDTQAPDQGEQQRLELRARAHQLMIDCCTALVVASAGGAMALTSPAQRKAREALFLLVQAQTVDGRRAQLRSWGH